MLRIFSTIGGALASAFNIIQTPNGTSPTASGPSILTFTSNDSSVVITGDAGTNTIDFQSVGAGGAPGGSSGNVQYNSGGTFGGIPDSTVGASGEPGSVALSRLAAGTTTPLSAGDTYGFIDGGFVVNEHGIGIQSLFLGSDTTTNTYSIGNISGQSTGGVLSFTDSTTSLSGGSSDLNLSNGIGAQVFLSGSDGSVSVVAAGPLGGLYADSMGNTYLGQYAGGESNVIDYQGNMTVAAQGALPGPPTIFQVGPSPGTGGAFTFNGVHTNDLTFFDIASGSGSYACSIRVFTNVQCGEFAAIANASEYFTNSLPGDVALKGDPGSGNRFLIGVGSSTSQVTIGSGGMKLSNLTSGRVLIAGTGGLVTNDAGLTYVSGSGLKLNTVGEGFYVKEGTNARMGVSTLVGGTVTISNTTVTAVTRLVAFHQNSSGTIGTLSKGTVTAGTSFVINSSNPLDTSSVFWILFEPS